MVTNFKAQRIGDLVFIDVVEISTATVSSGASRDRASSTAGVAGASGVPRLIRTTAVLDIFPWVYSGSFRNDIVTSFQNKVLFHGVDLRSQ